MGTGEKKKYREIEVDLFRLGDIPLVRSSQHQ